MSKNRREALRVASFRHSNKSPQDVINDAEVYLKWLDGDQGVQSVPEHEYYYRINPYNGDVTVYRFAPDVDRGHILNKRLSRWFRAVSEKSDLSTGYHKVSFGELPVSLRSTVNMANSRGVN